MNLLRIEEQLSAARPRMVRVYVECLPYAEVSRRYDSQAIFYYIDPPYWGCENDYGKGIFEKDDFNHLAEILSAIEVKFLLSLNDKPEVRNVFKIFFRF